MAQARLALAYWMVCTLILVATTSGAYATDQTIILRIGFASTFQLERPFKTVVIGNPNVVDVLVQSDRSVILRPLNLGTTNIVFLDYGSIAITNVGILVCKATGTSRINYQDEVKCEDVDGKKFPPG
jgi:Flp pilus assembly secretin CpaC